MQVTERLSNFIVDTRYSDLPAKAIDLARCALLDFVGVALAAVAEPVRGILLDFVDEMGGREVSTVIGGGIRTSPPLAALANGVLGHVLDFDDIQLTMLGHPSVAIMPAVLALGEREASSGRDVILSYVIGVEIAAKVAAGINPPHAFKGWHATGTLGVMGATAAGAKLLNLDLSRARMALGIAGSSASGVRRNFGTMTKSFHAGHAARNGVVAALLAQKGWTAHESILEGPMGFYALYAAEARSTPERAVAGVGDPFEIVEPGVEFKWHPSCAATHYVLEAIFKLLEAQKIDVDDVETVECGVHYREPQLLINYAPTKGLEGKFSLPYCVARLLIDGTLKMEDFTDEKVQDPRAQAFLSKVNMYVHPKFASMDSPLGAVVTIRTKSGKEFESEVLSVKGSTKNPLTWAELTAKFRECAGRALPDTQMNEVIELIAGLEDLEDIRTLMKVLAKTRRD